MVLALTVHGEGQPIVLLPWFGLDATVLAAAFEPVFSASTGWRRIYLDLPGTGRSSPVAANSDTVLDAVSDTVGSVVGAAPFLLAGCSYGGYLAAGLARRMPAQVSALLLVCAGVKIRPEDRNLDQVLSPTPQHDWLDDVPAELHDHFARAIGNQTRSVASSVAAAMALSGSGDDDYLARLRSTGYQLSDERSPRTFDGDVTVLAGRHDRIAGVLDQFAALSLYPQGSFVALNAAGHYLPFEQPQRFKAITLDWLAQADRHHPQTPHLG